jgi:predicted dehydrogenase
VGCGAITENGHAPGALQSRYATLTTLVDVDIERARVLGRSLGITDCRSTIDELERSVDGVVAALPHHVHESVGVALLEKGLHVLMEKPLGCSVAECEALSGAARRNNRVLATALMRRFSSCNRLAKKLIEAETLGKVVSFEIRDGRPFSWPIKTPFLLKPGYPGRGVLIGNGSHFLDLVLWWFGDVSEVACSADTRNGGETDAIVTLKMKSGVHGTLELSRIRDLDDAVIIRFERATLVLPAFGSDVRLQDREGRPMAVVLPALDDPRATNSAQMADLMALQIDAFVMASRGEGGPEAGPEIATKAIALVERCASAITVESMPWQRRRVFSRPIA